MILYADDAVLLCVDKTVQNLKIKSESEFSKIENWIKNNRLSLNYKKSNCILFNNNKQNSSPKIDIKSQNGIIPTQNVVKYLGVMIDHKLSWENHIMFCKNYVSQEEY